MKERRTMKLRFNADNFPVDALAAMLGPQAAAAIKFSRLYQPFWWLP